MYNLKKTFTFILMLGVLFVYSQENINSDTSLKWQEGYLDIHFIHNGRGNASFMVFPDGTSLLYDAGDSKKGTKNPNYPPFSQKNISAGERVVNYIKHFSPTDTLDYALISHFHNDHYGTIKKNTITSKNGAYKLSGITEVGDMLPIRILIDRAYPNYNYPYDLRTPKGKENKTMINYLKFIIHHQKESGMIVEQLVPGTNKQIIPLNQPQKFKKFEVRNIKVNDLIWTGKNEGIGKYQFEPPLVNHKGYYNENPLSLALKITYGKFDYYVGGDIPGVNKYPDYDIETPVANIIGSVDALTLDHHGYKDATNAYFLSRTKPQVIAHQSLHDPHFDENVQRNLRKSKAHVFSPYVSDKIKKWYGRQMKKTYKSTRGHFFIRVYPNGDTFDVFVLDEKADGYILKQKFGPYKSR